MQFILASQSPRRRELMGIIGVPFVVRVADIDETMDKTLPPQDEVARVSRKKAEAIPREPEDVVIAADTIVVCDHEILGKPRDARDACRMLRMLSGRDHQVMTGLTVLHGDTVRVTTQITDLHFRELSDREIERYVATGDPMDKAGSYGIQSGGALFAEKMVGDYYNVMGLPVCKLYELLREVVPQYLEETL